MTPQVMIVTGEASGDLHGANLVRSLKQKRPDLQICGMGGPELKSVGVELLFDAAKVSVVGIFEVFSHLKDILYAQRILRKRLETHRPSLLILIDLPDFNFLLARKAKRLGIPVFYYISPQVWAWRSGRVKTIKKLVDKIGVILPFEEKYFRERGVAAEYVGHPLLDSVKTTGTKDEFYKQHKISPDCKCIGLLPGSRKREISSLLPIFMRSAEILQTFIAEPLVFLVPQASTITHADFEEAGLSDFQNKIDIRIIKEDRYNMMASCDAVVAASGTVTLELSLLEVPMVVVYKLAPLTYKIGKLLVKLDFFSLVNLIAGFEAVPELLQDEVQPERIATELSAFLTNTQKRNEIIAALQDVNVKLGEKGASQKAAEVALLMIQKNENHA